MSQTILITGTSSGFGDLMARTLVDQGHTVIATMRDVSGRNAAAAEGLTTHAAAAKGSLRALELDVTDDTSVTAAFAAAGEVDVLINNAGAGAAGPAEAFTVEQYQRYFDINVMGVHRTMRAALPGMRARGRGLVINISSVMGRLIIPFSGPYTTSKWALEGLTENYRTELLGTGVDIVSLEPGGFNTGIAGRMAPPDDLARVESYGALAGRAEQVWGPFMEMMAAPDAPSPQIVADRTAELVAMAPGTRPARIVVDPLTGGEGAEQVNAVSAAVQAQLNGMFGLTD